MDKVLEAYHCVFSAIETGDAIQEPDHHEILVTIEKALKKQLPTDTKETTDIQETHGFMKIEKRCKCGKTNPMSTKYCMECGQNISGMVCRM